MRQLRQYIFTITSKGVTICYSPCGLFLYYLKIRLQGFDVGLEGLLAFGGNAADGAVLHTTTANITSWDALMPSTWATWTAVGDWND